MNLIEGIEWGLIVWCLIVWCAVSVPVALLAGQYLRRRSGSD